MRSFFLVLFVIFCSLQLSSQSKDPRVESLIKQVENSLSPTIIYGDTIPKNNLETRMKELGIKGLSIAYIQDHKIQWAKAYGWADEASGRKATTETRFQAASISKSLNSLGLLKLVEEKKLDPEADINQYLKRWKFPYDSVSKGKKINTFHLLSHTAGLTVHGFPGYKTTDTLPSLPEILDGKKPANTGAVRSAFEPGLKFQYSGGGTTLSQLLVEDITGQPYAVYMQENVLKPLGMKSSSYQQPPVNKADLATGYYAQNGSPVKGNFHVYPEQAAAGLWTTPSDLARYIIECQLAYQGKSKKVLSQAMMKKRMTPYIDTVAALGVFIQKKENLTYFNHNGGNEAFLCTSYGSLENGKGLVIMINGDNFSIISELTNSIAQVYNWVGFFNPEYRKKITLPADSAALYAGNYQLNKDTITLKLIGTKLVIQQNGQPAEGYEVIFSDMNSFSLMEVPGANFKVMRNANGEVISLELKQGGGTFVLPRMK
ncbi:serine hydrolase domain-containing protein [Flavihumibacter sp. UBA7668]|uniref:serine hydrolase domain-containing protein n=1 Tax=Flavihumibacter sp. UBA7668 TaxID=1946542 RepID=UPI0025C4D9CD|nr:serine hydrolase domain-containing protein [Flavihumibacter sp. UBA7668]